MDQEEAPKRSFTFQVFHFATKFDKWLIAAAVLCNGLTGLGMPIFNLVMGGMMDDMSDGKNSFVKFVKIQLYIGAGMFVLGGTGVACLEWVAERQIKQMRYQYLRAIMRQEIGWFDTFDTGTLASSLNKNCVTIRDGIGMKLGQLFMFTFMFFGGYAVGFYRSWRMTLVLSSTLPVMMACGFVMMYLMTALGEQGQKAYAKAGSVAEEIFGNIRTVVAFGGEAKSVARFDTSLQGALKLGIRAGFWNGMATGLVFACFFGTFALGFWYAAKLIADKIWGGCLEGLSKCLSPGDMMSVFLAVIMAALSLGQAGPSLTAFLEACGAAKELLGLIERESKIDPYSDEGVKDVKLTGEIVFQSVGFCFPARPDKAVYKKLDFLIPAGKTVALVGESGCGKSTAIQLIERYYDVTSGAVLLDGTNIKDFDITWLRAQMSIVTQEPRLFARSIKENIAYGKSGATDEEIYAAAKAANAHDFIMKFPQAYDTYVGEGGNQLSGGQKQRIAIARAMLRDPKILIIDEATSALDNESEKIVQKSLDGLIGAGSRTTIVIAHRLTTIRNADIILVFNNPNGEGAYIAEEGTHEDLVKIEGGIYRGLVLNQELGAVDKRSGRLNSLSSNVSLQSEKQTITRKRSAAQKLVEVTSQKTKKTVKTRNLYFRSIALLKPYWSVLFVALLGSAMAGCVFPMFAVIYAEFLEVLYSPDPSWIKSRSALLACMFVVLGGGALVAFTLRVAFAEWAGQRMIRDLRSKAFQAMVYQNISFFDDPMHTTGPLNEILSKEVLLMKNWCGDNAAVMIQNIASVICGLVIAFASAPKLAAVALAAFFILIPASALEMRALTGSTDDVKEASQSPGFIMNEAVINARIVAAYSLQEIFNKYHSDILDTSFKKGRKRALTMGFYFGLSQFLQTAVLALDLWYGGRLITSGEVTNLKVVMRTIFALMMAGQGVGQSMMFMADSQKAKEAAERVWTILDTQPTIDARNPEGARPSRINGAIEVRDVRFHYPIRPDQPIFSGVSFDVQPGQTVALVGASGCGKSTIIQLLERFYDVDDGVVIDKIDDPSAKAQVVTSVPGNGVKIDGHDVRELNVSYLRQLLGLVSQEPALFNTTIAENIRYGKADATIEEVIEAAKSANAHKFISEFPDGYETNVGSFGGQLSGGQKQRIAIARALLRSPKILLLDEATSALDSQSEVIVQEALDELMATSERTTLVIAHRLSTIRNADKIVVFKNFEETGSIVAEVGTHAQLMQKHDGVYRRLVMIAEHTNH